MTNSKHHHRSHNYKPGSIIPSQSSSNNNFPNKSDPKTTSPRPEPTIIKRRNSSFANSSSPWFRRNSFLSPSMIQNENFSVYESNNNYYSINNNPNGFNSNYSIISLRECQGFLFNQDLFASPYQQVKAKSNERRLSSATNSATTTAKTKIRRHTSYHSPRPNFTNTNNDQLKTNDHAIDDEYDEDEDMLNDEELEELEEEEDMEDMEGEEEEEDYSEMHGYGGDYNNRRYKVKVTDILIDESEIDIYPTS
ncbi:hypothetical protein KGF54_000227 [Candida jiufengensis]|uniref:uncharacterized protein n=1 Tax=Candida jiufengensis TaxID=497108 RepID=UPI002224D013|nr:uncharacterized protein KGF54_000227 [Candida jiufengensis]KAI5957299.1 hypothetical protein KGF54_000227 [Candida jiufengensis]